MKKSFVIVLCSLLLISCSNKILDSPTGASILHTQQEFNQEIYKYHPFVDDCDRFRVLFEQELALYPQLSQVMDLPALYALSYQESLCKTRNELKIEFEQNNDTRETWQGGIMQVDGCWRANLDCSSVKEEIEQGMRQLASSYAMIDQTIKDFRLTLTTQEKRELLLLGYNRGYYVPTTALRLLNTKQETGSFETQDLVMQENKKTTIFVNCPEKDRCSNDLEFIDVTNDMATYSTDLKKAMLLACRSKFGYMRDSQGDYCTGEDYGLNYPKANFKFYEKIIDNSIKPFQEKEFYSDQIQFSSYDWFVKTSIGKMGPGPNHFYLDERSVFVDEKGLHLNLLEQDGVWYSSEVVLSEPLGYGTYTFEVDPHIFTLHKNVVFGLFTYDLTFSEDPSYHHRELDAEFSRWADANADNVHFTVQGPNLFEPTRTFLVHQERDVTIRIIWQDNFASFELLDAKGQLIESFAYSGKMVPKPDQEHVRMNLWVFKESDDLREEEVVIKSFSFRPSVDLGVFGER